jgi:hypothetical protein
MSWLFQKKKPVWRAWSWLFPPLEQNHATTMLKKVKRNFYIINIQVFSPLMGQSTKKCLRL